MSLLDKASLIVTPNSYKESKLYSVVPNTTLGDMDVVRATTATRVNSAGLIEVVPRNLATYSEDFANAAWTKTNVTVSANATNSPTGILTADKLVENSANDIHFINGSSITFTAGTYSVSIFAKASERNVLQIFLNGSANVNAYANFNLTTGVVSAFNDCTATIQSFGDGWYRCILTTTVASSTVPSAYFCIQNSTAATRAASYLGNGTSGLFIWGAQLENFATATEYFPTTTRLNIPRIDYTNGSCPSLLVEPQRTNLLTYSEQFDNAAWLKYRLDLGINTQISPSGVQNADTFTSSVGQAAVPAIANQSFVFIGNTRYSYSIFAKKIGTTDSFRLGYVDNSTGYTGGTVSYNLTTQSITITQSPNASVTASMQSVGNGWYRLVLNFLTIATPTYNYVEINIPSTSVTNTFAIWGAQLELGSYPTSYIPTVASSVTRNADVISKTGVSSLIGQTEGTMFLEADIQKRNETDFYIGISNGYSLGEAIYLNQPSGGNLNILFRSAGLAQTINILSANWNVGNNKIAIAYSSTLGEVFINGVSKGTVALTAIPTCNQIALASRTDSPGGLIGAGPYKQAILFKTRLSNTELAQLTTL